MKVKLNRSHTYEDLMGMLKANKVDMQLTIFEVFEKHVDTSDFTPEEVEYIRNLMAAIPNSMSSNRPAVIAGAVQALITPMEQLLELCKFLDRLK